MMQKLSIEELKKQRELLLNEFLSIGASVIRGSILELYKRCGNKNCKCATGIGHGPKHYLSVSFPKSFPVQEYVPQKYVEQVKTYVLNYKKVHTILEAISNINRELLKQREIL